MVAPLCAAILATACVSEEVIDDPLKAALEEESLVLEQKPIVIPLAGRGSGVSPVLDRFYTSVLDQMREAYNDRDLAGLRTLLAAHRHPRAPGWAQDMMGQFESLTSGLLFEAHMRTKGVLEDPASTDGIAGAAVPLGAPFVLRFKMAGSSEGLPPELDGFVLGGESSRHPSSLRITFRITDVDGFGSKTRWICNEDVVLPEALVFGQGDVILPFAIEAGGGDSVMREFDVVVSLLPGYITKGDKQVPYQILVCASGKFVFYPNGVAVIRAEPLKTLRNAMRKGDRDHFPHVYLAIHFMADDEVDAATSLLMEWVRVGNDQQSTVAMSSLSRMTDLDIAVGDRRGWLQWYQRFGRGR